MKTTATYSYIETSNVMDYIVCDKCGKTLDMNMNLYNRSKRYALSKVAVDTCYFECRYYDRFAEETEVEHYCPECMKAMIDEIATIPHPEDTEFDVSVRNGRYVDGEVELIKAMTEQERAERARKYDDKKQHALNMQLTQAVKDEEDMLKRLCDNGGNLCGT